MASITGNTSKDVELLFPGDRFPVSVGPVLRRTGWRGGIWVQYITSPEGDFVVEVSDGNRAAGFILFQSEMYPPLPTLLGSPANWTSYQPATGVGGQNVMTMVNGGIRVFFRVFETQGIVVGARTGPDLVYTLNDALKVSENGLLCNDSDGDLATVGIAVPIVVGMVSAVPNPRNDERLGVDLKY